jgi:hypothetical protein
VNVGCRFRLSISTPSLDADFKCIPCPRDGKQTTNTQNVRRNNSSVQVQTLSRVLNNAGSESNRLFLCLDFIKFHVKIKAWTCQQKK